MRHLPQTENPYDKGFMCKDEDPGRPGSGTPMTARVFQALFDRVDALEDFGETYDDLHKEHAAHVQRLEAWVVGLQWRVTVLRAGVIVGGGFSVTALIMSTLACLGQF